MRKWKFSQAMLLQRFSSFFFQLSFKTYFKKLVTNHRFFNYGVLHLTNRLWHINNFPCRPKGDSHVNNYIECFPQLVVIWVHWQIIADVNAFVLSIILSNLTIVLYELVLLCEITCFMNTFSISTSVLDCLY